MLGSNNSKVLVLITISLKLYEKYRNIEYYTKQCLGYQENSIPPKLKQKASDINNIHVTCLVTTYFCTVIKHDKSICAL